MWSKDGWDYLQKKRDKNEPAENLDKKLTLISNIQYEIYFITFFISREGEHVAQIA